MRADQAGSSGAFGAVPVFVGTILIALIAMLVAIPVGLLSAIYLSEFASSRTRNWAKPMLEILAGIPTRITSYNVCYTKLLRADLSVSKASHILQVRIVGLVTIDTVFSGVMLVGVDRQQLVPVTLGIREMRMAAQAE